MAWVGQDGQLLWLVFQWEEGFGGQGSHSLLGLVAEERDDGRQQEREQVQLEMGRVQLGQELGLV